MFVILACSCIATQAGEVLAQVPIYAPYGAWRGRIRYVEGPFRTRSTIHWGNGVTPTGGQVLIHGLTVAGDVAGNLLANSGLGMRDAEQVRAAEQRNAQIEQTLTEIRQMNREIDANRKAVLKRYNLTPTEIVASNSDPGTYEIVAGVDLNPLFIAVQERNQSLLDNTLGLLRDVSEAKSLADEVRTSLSELRLTREQTELLNQLLAFIGRVHASFSSLPSAQVTVAGPVDALTRFADKAGLVVRRCKTSVELVADMEDKEAELRQYPFLGEPETKQLDKISENLGSLRQKESTWGDIPSFDPRVFEGVTVDTPATPAGNAEESAVEADP